jgi:hypothetical protein
VPAIVPSLSATATYTSSGEREGLPEMGDLGQSLLSALVELVLELGSRLEEFLLKVEHAFVRSNDGGLILGEPGYTKADRAGEEDERGARETIGGARKNDGPSDLARALSDAFWA